MPPSLLATLTLGYQLVWNPQRQAAGVVLMAEPHAGAAIDGSHLLGLLEQTWSEHSPRLILLLHSASLLTDVLAHATPASPWIVVPQALLAADPLLEAQARQAHGRGVRMVWRGEPGQTPGSALGGLFAQQLLSLNAGQALLALHAVLQPDPARAGAGEAAPTAAPSAPPARPVLAGQICENVASALLIDHCLDAQGAWGVAGWPVDDILHGYRNQQPIPPSHAVILRLVAATDADLALERIEHILAEEPVLVYRFLRYANSAALGLRTSIDSLRHGLMVLGLSTFKRWLLEQLPGASHDANLQPVRTAMLVRARIMEQLLDAGDEDSLRSEVLLCGLLSTMHLLLGEPLASALVQHFPVSERITGALLGNSGPYAPFLELSRALESPTALATLPALCETHQIDIGDVNRALLRALAQARAPAPKGRVRR